jgi:RNA polymerase sigma factor (sigma-70 family)
MMMDRVDLYAKYSDELLRFAAMLVGPSSAEDVLSSAILNALRSPAWASVDNRRAYLYRCVHNEARRQHRSARRRLAREALTSAREVAEDAEVRVEVIDALGALPMRQRAVVFLVYWADASVDEAARLLDVSPATVDRELRSARLRLRGLLS